MKIRSVTLGTPIAHSPAVAIARAGSMLTRIVDRLESGGFEVQTTRVSLPPLTKLAEDADDLLTRARGLDQAAAASGVGYVALGPIRWGDGAARAEQLSKELGGALAATERVFGSVETATAVEVEYAAVDAAARIVRFLADSTEGGFGNLRFAALAACPPGIPFFPAAYHDGPLPAFSLALQGADLALGAFETAAKLSDAEAALTRALDAQIAALEAIVIPLEQELDIEYKGVDPTLAPFPDDRESIGAALERLGVSRFGRAGTLTAAALVTRALKRTGGRRCGFAGLMLPVLEDSILARRATEGLFSWQELLLYSSVCGTGLDTVPISGDIPGHELAAMILDVATLAVALGKPLTCRLFPVPGKVAGDLTAFDFAYFANGGVLRTTGGSPTLLRRATGVVDP